MSFTYVAQQCDGEHHPRGFTFVEVVMVIVILSILVLIAIPRFDSYYSIKLEGAARKLVSNIRYTQQLSISQHEAHGIEFNVSSDNYRVFRVSDDSTATDPFTRSSFQIDYTTDLQFGGVELTSATFGTTDELRFTAMGVPQDESDADLTATGTVVLTLNGATQTIEVIRNTGKAGIQ